MTSWSEEEVILGGTLLWKYGTHKHEGVTREDVLERWPNATTREQFLCELIRCDFTQGGKSFDWLADELSLLRDEVRRTELIRAIFGDLARLDEQPSWTDFERLGYPPEILRLSLENEPVFLGQMLDNEFTLDRRLGAGGFSVVYEASAANNDAVAIKILRQQFAAAEALSRRDFLREAMRAASLASVPGVPDVLDVRTACVQQATLLFIVYRIVSGMPLTTWMRKRASHISVRWAANVVRDAARVLVQLHARSIYHRDLNLSNILVTDNEEVRLIDLGLSLAEFECMQAVALAGTKGFIPPEVIEHRRFHGPSSDIFGLGKVLGILLRFVHRTSGNAVDAETLGALMAVSEKACSPQPEDRFDNAVQFATAIDECIRPMSGGSGRPWIKVLAPRPRPFMDWGTISRLTKKLSDYADPERSPESQSRWAETLRVDLEAAMGLVDQLEGFRQGTSLVIPRAIDGHDYRSEIARLHWSIATHLRLRGGSLPFLMYARRALAFGAECGMPEHNPDEYSIWLDDVASILCDHGRHREALNFAQECLRLRCQSPTADNVFIHQAHNNYGEALRLSGDRVKARWHLRKFRSFVHSALGPDDNEYGWALSNLAQIAIEDGQWDAAQEFGERALTIKEHVLGEDHVQLSYVLRKLGTVATHRQDFVSADQHFERAALIHKEHQGNGHPATLRHQSRWAESLVARGERQRALRLCEAALEHLRFGPDYAECRKTLELAVKLSSELGYRRTCARYSLLLECVDSYQALEATVERQNPSDESQESEAGGA